jgi:plasmid stabilization system protein ParE
MKRITFHEEAYAEMNEAALYYEERAPGLGFTFLAEVEDAVGQVVTNPEAYQLVGSEVRHKPIRRFPYRLLYVVQTDCIQIIAIAHQKRRPRYWYTRR